MVAVVVAVEPELAAEALVPLPLCVPWLPVVDAPPGAELQATAASENSRAPA